jgi:hypothetical protein
MRFSLEQRQSAFATLVVLLLLSIVSVYMLSNALALGRLRREVRSIESSHRKALVRQQTNGVPNQLRGPNPVQEAASPGRDE